MRVIPTPEGICPSCRGKIASVKSQPVSANLFADPEQEFASTSVEPPKVDNPYISSLTPESETARSNPLLIPAYCLLVGSILWFLMSVWFVGLQLFATELLERGASEDVVALLIGYVLGSLLPVLTVTGSVSMLNRQSYRWAWIGACVALIPSCNPYLFLLVPFAIWAIVLLLCRDVKESFRRYGF